MKNWIQLLTALLFGCLPLAAAAQGATSIQVHNSQYVAVTLRLAVLPTPALCLPGGADIITIRRPPYTT